MGTTFSIGEKVAIRDTQSGKWSSVGQIVSKREHGGLGVRSYTLTNVNTGKLLTRNERHLRKLVDQQGVPGGERGTTLRDIPTSDHESDEDSVSSVRSVYTTGRDTGRSATHKLHRKVSHTIQYNTIQYNTIQ